jgi:hypothetical protein
MSLLAQRWFRKLCRRGLSGFLSAALTLLILSIGGLVYLHAVGAPEFLKARWTDKLRSGGIEVGLGKVRLERLSSVVADRVEVSFANPPFPAATLNNVRLHLSLNALKKLRFEPESLTVQQGQVLWPLENPHPSHLAAFDNLAIDFRLFPNANLQVAQFSLQYKNADVRADISITNAAAIRQWNLPQAEPDPDKPWHDHVTELLRKTEHVQFADGAVLKLKATVDGHDPNSLRAELELRAPALIHPQGQIQQLEIKATAAPEVRGQSALDLQFRCEKAEAAWGGSGQMQLGVKLFGSVTNRAPDQIEWRVQMSSFRAHAVTGQSLTISGQTEPDKKSLLARSRFNLEALDLETRWGCTHSNVLTAESVHGWRDVWESAVDWSLLSHQIETVWGSAASARVTGHVKPSSIAAQGSYADDSWGFWRWLAPFDLDWTSRLDQVTSPGKLDLETFDCSGTWRVPDLDIPKLRAELYGGQFEGEAQLDVATRELNSRAFLDFDVHKISALLTPVSRRWLSQYGWDTPPAVTGQTRLILPAWTNTHPNWREEVLPTIELEGAFSGTNGSFRAVPVAFASSDFSLSNFVWRLPNLFVRRPDGEAQLGYTGDMRTQEYFWRIECRADPRALLPLLEGPAEIVLGEFEFSEPVCVSGEVWGRWHEPETLAFQGQIAARDFTFRGDICHELAGSVQFTNLFLGFTDVVARQNQQQVAAPEGGYDLARGVIFLTNAISTMDPDLIGRVIGPKTRAALRPYHFETPPTVRVNGRLPTFDLDEADVFFEVAGESFNYWQLYFPSVTSDLHWRGRTLAISNVQASFYSGTVNWEGDFDFSNDIGADFRFQGDMRQVDLRALMSGVGQRVNRVEGILNGQVVISSANSRDMNSWQGHGQVRLHDGFLWEIPIFGIFSPVLDAIIPGLGNSPVSAGTATFEIRNSVLRTSNLELRSPALRLQYYGSVDYEGHVDARMQAEILRDAWGIGPVLSFILRPISKAFEYEITGTIHHPHSEPVYIPRILLWPLRPIRTIKRIFGFDDAKPKPPRLERRTRGGG